MSGPISLSDLKLVDFWTELSDPESKRLPFTVVLPSGRSQLANNGQLGLISDALYTYEILSQLGSISRAGNLSGLSVTSMLDIDFYEHMAEFRRPNPPVTESRILQSNLFLLATADVNVISRLFLDEVRPEETFRVGFRKPYEDCILCGGRGNTYTVATHPNAGMMSVFWNPWAKDKKRVVFFCGGVLATGTLAASRLLLNYLTGEANGNNLYRPNAPVKIVSATEREYRTIQLLPLNKCIPRHNLVNITEELEIHE